MSDTTDATRERGQREATLFSDMAKSILDFWQTVMDETVRTTRVAAGTSDYQAGSLRPWTAKSMQEILDAMRDAADKSGLLDSLPKGMQKSLEIYQGLTETWFAVLNDIMEETLAGIMKSLENAPDCRQEGALRAFLKAYTNSIQRLLKLPKIGLNRYYLEHLSQAADQLNLFTVTATEFSLLMMQPLESTLIKMQQQIREMADNGTYLREAKDYYALWIKILEGDYANLLRSPEYVRVFHNVLHTYLEFIALNEAVMEDSLKSLPVVTKKDMEAVYRENYELKKEIKAISRRLAELEERR
jgi:hypothetical protein